MTRRILAIALLAVAFSLLACGAAFGAAVSGYAENPVGADPHEGYLTTTTKCAVCHAVHKGSGAVGSEMLLRTSAAEACTYCHINPGVSTLIVYDGLTANYSGSDNVYSHNNFGATPVKCELCHAVHAAQNQMTDNAILSGYMLTAPSPAVGYDWDSDWDNEGAPLAGDPKDVAISKWCTRCHTYWPGTPPDPVDSHVLTAFDGVHSWTGSEYCVSCHSSDTVGGVAPAASAFPHFTDGARFLTQAATDAGGEAGAVPATNGTNDGVCLRCHRDGSGTVGVGFTF